MLLCLTHVPSYRNSNTAKMLVWVVGLKLLADAHEAEDESLDGLGDPSQTAGVSLPVHAISGKDIRYLQYWATVAKAVYERSDSAFCDYLARQQPADAATIAAAAHQAPGSLNTGPGATKLWRAAVGGLQRVVRSVGGSTGDSATATSNAVTPSHVLHARWQAQPSQPAHVVYIDHNTRSVVLGIRGTHSVHDALTDLGLAAVSFHDSYAHQGIAESAAWIVKEATPALASACASHPDYSVVVAGHSLGAGCAVLATMLLRDISHVDAEAALHTYTGSVAVRVVVACGVASVGALTAVLLCTEHADSKPAAGPSPISVASAAASMREATCVAFATPACLSPKLAREAAPFVTNVILGADAIPRSSESALVHFLNELVTFSADQVRPALGCCCTCVHLWLCGPTLTLANPLFRSRWPPRTLLGCGSAWNRASRAAPTRCCSQSSAPRAQGATPKTVASPWHTCCMQRWDKHTHVAGTNGRSFWRE